jgi:hypothetical protein
MNANLEYKLGWRLKVLPFWSLIRRDWAMLVRNPFWRPDLVLVTLRWISLTSPYHPVGDSWKGEPPNQPGNPPFWGQLASSLSGIFHHLCWKGMGVLPSFLGVAGPIQNARVERRNMVAKHGVLSILKASRWRFLSRTPELDTSVNRGTWRKTEVVGRIIRIASPEERQLLEAGWLKDAERDSGT